MYQKISNFKVLICYSGYDSCLLWTKCSQVYYDDHHEDEEANDDNNDEDVGLEKSSLFIYLHNI